MRFKKNVFMPFLVIGDPEYGQSIRLIKTLIDNGADALELGFAFSDPIADGPAIQRANKRALDNNITTAKAFEILKLIREYSEIPISLMLSFNIVYNYGIENFYEKCVELNIDAVLCPDVPLEESRELLESAEKYKIHQVFLISPETSVERMRIINQVCSGYVYLVSLLGTTGARDKINQELLGLIKLVKQNMEYPVYVGFGISKPEHVQEMISLGADGVICGSAFCKLVEENLDNYDKMEEAIRDFSNSMRVNNQNHIAQ